MNGEKVSVTADGELRIKVGRDFGLDEAVRCMRGCSHRSGDTARHLVFDLMGTQTIQTAGLGFMLMVKERCQLKKENAVIVYDNPRIGQMLYLSHFEEKFQLVMQSRQQSQEHTHSVGETRGEAT